VPQVSFPEPLLTPIERPRCPNCQTRMMVVRIEAPALPAPICGHSDVATAKTFTRRWLRTR
jgi:hypothetical protein